MASSLRDQFANNIGSDKINYDWVLVFTRKGFEITDDQGNVVVRMNSSPFEEDFRTIFGIRVDPKGFYHEGRSYFFEELGYDLTRVGHEYRGYHAKKH